MGWRGEHVNVPLKLLLYGMPHWHKSMLHGVLSKTSSPTLEVTQQRSSLVREILAMEICESTYPFPAENHFNFEEPLKGRKKWLTCSDEISAKPTRNANLAQFSRENFVKFGFGKWQFRCGEITIVFRNIVFTSTVSGPAGCVCICIFVCVCVCAYICIYIYTNMIIYTIYTQMICDENSELQISISTVPKVFGIPFSMGKEREIIFESVSCKTSDIQRLPSWNRWLQLWTFGESSCPL